MDSPSQVVIIGSGPTALGAALRLNQLIEDGRIAAEVTILEAADRVGGLASSVTSPRGFTWDLGVHVTGQSKYDEFLNTIDEAVGEWNYIPRCVQASMRHVFSDCPQKRSSRECYVPYPVQDSISHFPLEIRQKCEEELMQLSEKDISNEHSANFGDFALHTFGETLTELFIRPYNEKVWTVPLCEMAATWVEGRVPRPSSKQDNGKTQQNVFRYPTRLRGVGEVWKKVAMNLPQEWIKLRSPVTRIDPHEKRVIISNGYSFPFDILISTMPIDILGQISGLAPSLPLKHSKVILVGIGIRRPQPPHTEPLSWLYFPQPDTIFYRVTFVSNFNEYLTPNAALFWSVLCEIGVDSSAEVNREEIVEKTIKDLIKEGIIQENSEIEDRWLHVLPYGYPIPSLDRDETLANAQKTLESNNIYSRGR